MKYNFSLSEVGIHKIIPKASKTAYCKFEFSYVKPIKIKNPKIGITRNNLYFLNEIVQKTSNILKGYRKTFEVDLLRYVIANNENKYPKT
jgi:hypothetical protein